MNIPRISLVVAACLAVAAMAARATSLPPIPPLIHTPATATFTVNSSGTFTVGATATTISLTGALPSGVTFTPGLGLAVIAGTPAPGTVGTYPLSITATNGVPPDAHQAFFLTVAKASQTISFSKPAHQPLSNTPLALVASASSNLPVTFTSETPQVCAVAGSLATLLAEGACTIDADQAGDADTSAAPTARQTFAVYGASGPPRMWNIATRLQVLAGSDVLISGFVISGTGSKKVAIVATGPSLAQYGIASPLANPTLTLMRSSDQAVIATNDDWQAATNAAELSTAGFAPPNPLEAALLVDLPPGAYTAIVQGAGGETGVGVVGVYEVDHPEVGLINICTRGRVLTGNDVMIGGLIIKGTVAQTVAIVATGPSLAQFGIAGVLANPTLTLVRQSDQTTIATNDNWQTAANAGTLQSLGFAPSSPLESAILITLEPGEYTAILSGVGGGTGVGVIGVYATD